MPSKLAKISVQGSKTESSHRSSPRKWGSFLADDLLLHHPDAPSRASRLSPPTGKGIPASAGMTSALLPRGEAMRHLKSIVPAALWCLVAAGAAHSQPSKTGSAAGYPGRPVRLVVP